MMMIIILLQIIMITHGYRIDSKNEIESKLPELPILINTRNPEEHNVNKIRSNEGRYKDYDSEKDLHDIIDKRDFKGLLVKRLVPHGFPTVNYEYNKKDNSIYIPMVRVHVDKPRFLYSENHKQENGLSEEIDKVKYKERANEHRHDILEPKKFDHKKDIHQNDVDNELLEAFSYGVSKKTKEITLQNILDNIKTYLGSLHSKSEVRELKYAILGVIENFHTKPRLRVLVTKSEEIDTPDSSKGYVFEPKEPVTSKPKKLLPRYSFWNYWTQDKPLYQDHCPDGLVQQGNLCIQVPH